MDSSLADLCHFGGDVGKNSGDALLPEILSALYVIDRKHQALHALFAQLLQQSKIKVLVVEMPRERRDLFELYSGLQWDFVGDWRQWPGAIELPELPDGNVIK